MKPKIENSSLARVSLESTTKKNKSASENKKIGSGECRNRTGDLVHAKHALYQLS
jgi:hypothetical protein